MLMPSKKTTTIVVSSFICGICFGVAVRGGNFRRENKTTTKTTDLSNQNSSKSQISSNIINDTKNQDYDKSQKVERYFDINGKLRKEITLNVNHLITNEKKDKSYNKRILSSDNVTNIKEEETSKYQESSYYNNQWSFAALYPLSSSAYKNGFVWKEASFQISRKIIFETSLVLQSDFMFQHPMIGVNISF